MMVVKQMQMLKVIGITKSGSHTDDRNDFFHSLLLSVRLMHFSFRCHSNGNGLRLRKAIQFNAKALKRRRKGPFQFWYSPFL